tara:strand:+ start:323 stop:2659 length:2337 start_codon:yes stop_codon:yes gene_type:complete
MNKLNHNIENTFSKDLNLGDYLTLFRIHMSKIILTILIGTVLSIYFTYVKSPIYRATTSVIVRNKPGSSMIMNVSGNNNKQKMDNEIQLIKSRSVAKDVVKRFWDSNRRDRMDLFGTRKYYPKGESFRRTLKEIFSLGLYEKNKETNQIIDKPYEDSIGERYASRIIKNMQIKTNGNTDIIMITYSSVFADEARRIANMIATAYRDIEKEIGNKDASLTVLFLKDLVAEQEINLFKVEEEIKQFKIDNNIYTSDGDAGLITAQLNSIESELYDVQSEISIRNEKINFLNSKLSESEKNLTKKILSDINAQMGFLRNEITTLESQLIQNESAYGKGHGAVLELKKKIELMKTQLKNKVNDLINKGITVQDPLEDRQDNITELLSIESEIFGLNLRKEETFKLQNIYSEKLSKLPQLQLEFSRLIRNEEVLNQNYTLLREKLEEAKIQLSSTSGRVQILDVARRPAKPVSPNHRNDIIFGILVSIITSILIVASIEILDSSIRSPSEINKQGLTILGIIPSIGNSGKIVKKGSIFNFDKKNKNASTNMQRRLITREDPRSPVSESYRSLRTSLLYTDVDKQTKSILVSSAGPGEGKTTTVANMAITYANLGKKTLLIDTDLRRPVVHKVLELNKEPGITDYLAGYKDDFNSLVQNTDIDNLYVVTSGVIPPNPSELLGSKKMSNLVQELEESWDVILFDSPPLVAVTDATMISKEIDKIVIVVKVGQTDKKAFEHTINSLKNVNSPIGGVVLNAVTQNNSYGSYYYYYQYYHYYGSDNEK